MAGSPKSGMELHEENLQQMEEFSKDFEKMVEVMENISVQLTWMAYDMVVLRTSPEVGESLRRVEEEFLQCKAVLEGAYAESVGRSTE